MRMKISFDLPRVAVLVWGALALGLAVHGGMYPWTHSVYDIYARAGRNWWAGHDLYVGGRDYYRYSPLFAALVSPFALLADQWGTPLWKAGNMVFYGFSLWTWARRGLPVRLDRGRS